MKIALLVAVSVLASPHAQEPQALPSVKLPPELDRVLRDYEKGWAKGDGKAISLLFTEDGYLMQPGRTPVHGRAAIEKAYQREGSPLFLRAFAYHIDGTAGFLLGGYAYEQGVTDHGKFTLALRKVGGRWLIASDMDNSNHRS